MATHDQMQQLIKVCLKCGINESVVTYSKLMRSGFVVLSGNNESFKKLNESETCFEAKQVNESSWLIKDKTKKLYNDEWDNYRETVYQSRHVDDEYKETAKVYVSSYNNPVQIEIIKSA